MDTQGLMRLGFAFVCACCTKLPSGIAAGKNGCDLAGTTNCGGPLLGKSFPMYSGPLTRQTRASLCFRCGEAGKMLLRTRDGGYVAVCEQHLRMFPEIKKDENVVERQGIRE